MDTAEAASETAGIATAVSEQLAAAAEGGVLTEEQLRAAFEKASHSTHTITVSSSVCCCR